jgi:metal-sulfur cluster biosynthetic enzyme
MKTKITYLGTNEGQEADLTLNFTPEQIANSHKIALSDIFQKEWEAMLKEYEKSEDATVNSLYSINWETQEIELIF